MKKLQSLRDFNAARFTAARVYEDAKPPELMPNGIECPECGVELVDSDPGMLMSNPPQKTVACQGCGFTGTRFV